MIIDSHAHILDPALDQMRSDIIDNMASDNLLGICEVGFNLASSHKATQLAHSQDNIFAIIGTHPEDAAEWSDDVAEQYRSLAREKKVVAFGEIGLDYHYIGQMQEEDLVEQEALALLKEKLIDRQKDVFVRQIVLADELGLPLVLHIRDAIGDCLDILTAHKNLLNHGVLLHCFTGSAEMVARFCKLNCYFALGGVVTFKNAKKDDVIKAIPQDRLLVETDCPYMAPTPFRGQLNQPKYSNLTMQKIADTLQMNVAILEKIVLENTIKFFNLSRFDCIKKETL
ncbi:MAG: TatD family hydrolase [Clostridia bacterium]